MQSKLTFVIELPEVRIEVPLNVVKAAYWRLTDQDQEFLTAGTSHADLAAENRFLRKELEHLRAGNANLRAENEHLLAGNANLRAENEHFRTELSGLASQKSELDAVLKYFREAFPGLRVP